jgi:sacsin
MVWLHLEHMAQMAQHLRQEHVQSFLSDLHRTYAYLQDHLEESRKNFNQGSRQIWLNLNSSNAEFATLGDVKCSWNGIKDLVLSSSCDAGSVKAVRPALMRYETLLRALGCHSITYPTVTRPSLHHGHSVSTSLRGLREQGKLLDATYYTEGKYIKAHRVVLAAVSEKCAAQFSSGLHVEDVIPYDSNDSDFFLSYHTLSTMINYAYEDEVNWSEMEVTESDDADTRAMKLDMLLDLHGGADFWMIPALKSQVEDKILGAGKLFINIENVLDVKQHAEDVRAKATAEMCGKFIQNNCAAVERANSGVV